MLDPEEAEGPLAGIYAALSWAKTPRLLVVAGDLPLLTADLLRKLAQLDPQAEAVAPCVEGYIQPLCAVYQTRLLPTARKLLWRGERAAVRLFSSVHGKAVAPELLGERERVCLALRGVNTAQDLEEISD